MQRIHIVGIGGAGMSAIARILLLQGNIISGSDRSAGNSLTAALVAEGAIVYQGHAAEHVQGADLVLATSAVPDDHVELAAARASGIPVYRRKDYMAQLMRGKKVIAVAGTHGKTTTTAMIVHVLQECGHDPSYIVGGVMANTNTNAGVGSGDAFVIEADEYGDMFHGLRPDVVVLTNLEYDHPDYFASEATMLASFIRFLRIPGETSYPGRLIVCSDSPLAMRAAAESSRDITTYGSQGDYRVIGYESGQFDVAHGERVVGQMRLDLPGEHNAHNALAALLVVDLQPEAFAALAAYRSTGRRFEVRGEVNDVVVIDDYAHHPTAIRVTLVAARQRYPGRAIWAVWQPHMYTRTRALIDDYASAFVAADHVVITDIYAAREAPIAGVDGSWTASRIQHPGACYGGGLADTTALLLREVQAPAVIVVMSAGDAPQISAGFLSAR